MMENNVYCKQKALERQRSGAEKSQIMTTIVVIKRHFFTQSRSGTRAGRKLRVRICGWTKSPAPTMCRQSLQQLMHDASLPRSSLSAHVDKSRRRTTHSVSLLPH